MLRTVLCTHAAPNTPADRWQALADSLAHLLDGFPRVRDRSASTTLLSGPARASLTLRPACLLDLLSGPLSQGFAVAVARLPSSGFSAPDSYRGVSTELLGWDFHPLEWCTLMAHVESAGGAVPEGMPGPFPPRRSSNRTCGSTASGSRTDFTRGIRPQEISQLDHAKVTMYLDIAEPCCPAGQHVSPSQEIPCTRRDV